MNLEKFVKKLYVMVIITSVLAFFGVELVKHIISFYPEKGQAYLLMDRLWLVPVVIGAYVWWSATIVSFVSLVTIFLGRPLKSYEDKGLIDSLITGLIMGLITGFVTGLVSGLIDTIITGLITSLVAGPIMGLVVGFIFTFILGLIFGLSAEFHQEKPAEEPADIQQAN